MNNCIIPCDNQYSGSKAFGIDDCRPMASKENPVTAGAK